MKVNSKLPVKASGLKNEEEEDAKKDQCLRSGSREKT